MKRLRKPMERSCLINERELREDLILAIEEEFKLSLEQFIKFINYGLLKISDKVVNEYVCWLKKLPEGKEIVLPEDCW